MNLKKKLAAFLASFLTLVSGIFQTGMISSAEKIADISNNISVDNIILLQKYLVNNIYLGKDSSEYADYNNDGNVDVFDVISMKRDMLNKSAEEKMIQEYINRMAELVNEERASKGIDPVKINAVLTDAAMLRAKEISESFSHTRPDGSDCFTVLNDYNIAYYNAAENIAAGRSTPESTMNQWINSSGHYKNLMNPNYSEIGIGYCYAPDTNYKYYWVQLFINP